MSKYLEMFEYQPKMAKCPECRGKGRTILSAKAWDKSIVYQDCYTCDKTGEVYEGTLISSQIEYSIREMDKALHEDVLLDLGYLARSTVGPTHRSRPICKMGRRYNGSDNMTFRVSIEYDASTDTVTWSVTGEVTVNIEADPGLAMKRASETMTKVRGVVDRALGPLKRGLEPEGLEYDLSLLGA